MTDMNHNKTLIITLFLVIFTLFGGCTQTEEQPAVMVPFFPDRHGFDLNQIAIADTDSALVFKRIDCVWVVGDENKPSDEPRVTELAEALVGLTPQLETTITPNRLKDFKVDEDNFSLRVVLTFKDNSSYTLLIGMPALTKPVYIRPAETFQVYTTDIPLLRQINLDSSSWLAPAEG